MWWRASSLRSATARRPCRDNGPHRRPHRRRAGQARCCRGREQDAAPGRGRGRSLTPRGNRGRPVRRAARRSRLRARRRLAPQPRSRAVAARHRPPHGGGAPHPRGRGAPGGSASPTAAPRERGGNHRRDRGSRHGPHCDSPRHRRAIPPGALREQASRRCDRPSTPHAARDRGTRHDRRGARQQNHRRAARYLAAHRQVPHRLHLREAQRREPYRGGHHRRSAGADFDLSGSLSNSRVTGPHDRQRATASCLACFAVRLAGLNRRRRSSLLGPVEGLAPSRCRTRAIDPVFIWAGDVGVRPNAPIFLTINAAIRDREGAARIRSARYATHAVSLIGGAMVRRAYRQRSLVEVLLPDGDKLWDPTLRQIDTLLDDDVLVDRVAEALAQRHPQSRRRGRLGTPATVVLRMLVLKHLSDWSFDECEREVRGSLVYRAFCRIDGERVPDAKTLIRLARLLDEPVLKDVLARLVALGRERRVVRGRRLRVDTTVVETNIHYPTDATLLADGVRVLTRGLRRIGERVRERTRSVARRVFEIAQRSRTASPRTPAAIRARSQAKMKVLYRGLMGITRAVVRQAEAAVARTRRRSHAAQLSTTVELVRRVLAQTRARVLHGDTHYPDKVVSLFEPHTDIIRKGKLTKPTEFGRLVKIQEAEAQFITDYAVCERRQADGGLWGATLDRHIELFGRPPQLAVADGGFASATNERVAHERGIRHVVLPRQPRATRSRIARLALRWRTGSEGRISSLKRRHGLRRCRYRGESGMQRWVGLGVIANNLLVLGRAGP